MLSTGVINFSKFIPFPPQQDEPFTPHRKRLTGVGNIKELKSNIDATRSYHLITTEETGQGQTELPEADRVGDSPTAQENRQDTD
jgi:hypothetical protein